MKKKIIAICLCVALVAVGIVGATLAYFTDTDKVENTFAIGNVSIDLWEYAGVGEFSENNIKDYYKFENKGEYSEIMPGDQMVKAPVIKNDGKNDAYVRVAVTMNNVTPINKAIDEVYEAKGYTAEQIQEVYDNVFKGWGMSYTKRNVDGNNDRRLWMKERKDSEVLFDGQIDMFCKQPGTGSMFDVKNTFKSDTEIDAEGFDYTCNSYYYNSINVEERIYVFYLKLAPGETYQLFNGLEAPKDFTEAQMKMFDNLKIGIYADAIQTAGFTTAEAAFNALEAEHPLGWWN